VAAPAFLPWGGQWGAADIMEGPMATM